MYHPLQILADFLTLQVYFNADLQLKDYWLLTINAAQMAAKLPSYHKITEFEGTCDVLILNKRTTRLKESNYEENGT